MLKSSISSVPLTKAMTYERRVVNVNENNDDIENDDKQRNSGNNENRRNKKNRRNGKIQVVVTT